MKIRGFILIGMSLLAVNSAVARDVMIVEASRRATPLQDVPVAVTAISSEEITKLQITSIQDIGDSIPNLQTYQVTANGAAMQLHARGASVQNPGFNTSESPVGLYVDDIYHGRLASANLDLNDIERIEVLRGPQATLYGRNTIAGAIKVYSRDPGDDFWASGSVGYGKYETQKITASVGGPIKEGILAGSVSGLYHYRGEGFQNQVNPFAGTVESVGEYDNKAARGKLHFYGSDNFDATLSLWAAEAENDGYNGVPYIPFLLAPGGIVPPGNTDVTLDHTAADKGSPLFGFYSNASPPGVNYGDSSQSGATLDMKWSLGENVDLRSITGYADIDDQFGFDLGGGGFFTDEDPPVGNIMGPFPGLLISSDSNMESISQEFQLLGNSFSDNLDWIIGLYFLDEDGEQNYAGDIFGVGNLFTEDSQSGTTSYAAYAEGTWSFTEVWSLTAGARWSRDKKDYDLTCAGFGCDPASDNTNSISLNEDWSNLSPKLSLNAELNDNLLMYLSVANGFQAGGFQTLCFGNLQCGEATYDPQEVWSYEYGIKSDWFDNRLRTNFALFYAQYEDIQQTVPRFDSNFNLTFPSENVGDVDVWGVELEVNWAPIDNLNVFANLGWMDADKVDFVSDFGPGSRDLPSNPDFTVRAGADYTINITSNLELFFGGDANYSDEYYNDVNNAILIDDYTRFNTFLGIGRSDNRWQLVGEWKNITNEQDNVSGLLFDGATNMRTVLPPLEYMITLKVNY